MSIDRDEEIKRWVARRKSAVILDIIRGKIIVRESFRQFDLPPSEIESWIDQAKAGMENALKAKPKDIRGAVRVAAQSASGGVRRSNVGTVFLELPPSDQTGCCRLMEATDELTR
jgi:hypothetical protein